MRRLRDIGSEALCAPASITGAVCLVVSLLGKDLVLEGMLAVPLALATRRYE